MVAFASGCTSPPAEAPDASHSGEQAPAAPAETGGTLPADLAACALPTTGSPWVETGRADDAGATYVMLESSESGAAAEFSPAVARLSGGACESYLMYATDGSSDTDVAPPSTDAMNRMLDGSFAWHVAQSGSAQAYADVQREFNGGVLNECPPDEDLGPCIGSWLALRFRGAGVEVGADG